MAGPSGERDAPAWTLRGTLLPDTRLHTHQTYFFSLYIFIKNNTVGPLTFWGGRGVGGGGGGGGGIIFEEPESTACVLAGQDSVLDSTG